MSASAPAPGSDADRLQRLTASNRTLLAKSSLTIASRFAGKLTQLLWLVLAARLLSVDEFAAYGYVVSIALTFCVLGDAGIGLIAGREISAGRLPSRRAFWGSLPWAALIGLIVAVLFCVFLAVSGGPGVNTGAVLAGAAFILSNRLFDIGSTSLRSIGRIEFEAGLQLVNAFLFVALATAVALAGGSVALVLATLAFKELASAVAATLAMRRSVGPYERVPLRSTLGLLRLGLVLSLASFGLAVCTRVPLVVLGNVASAAEVAYYAAVVRFADTALALSITAGFGLMPGLAHIDASDPARARSLIRRGLIVLGVGAIVVAIPLVVWRDGFARFVFGSSYGAAGDAFGVLMAGLPVLAVTGLAWYALLTLRHEWTVFAAAWAGFAVALVLSLLLADAHGSAGAAGAYVGGVAMLAVILLAGLARAARAPVRAGADEPALARLVDAGPL